MSEKTSTELDKSLSVGEVAKRSGVPVSTLHFYEAKGLITSWRSSGNQRRYAREVLRSVAIIKIAQRTGIPLDTIRQTLAAMPKDKVLHAKEWSKLSAAWYQELDTRIRKLTQLRDDLAGCIGCGCLSLVDCPLRNPDDVLGKAGSGARLLESDVDIEGGDGNGNVDVGDTDCVNAREKKSRL